MSDDLIRAGLDQALLALAALEAGDLAEAATRAAIGQIFATAGAAGAAGTEIQMTAQGPLAGTPTTRSRAELDVFAQWQADLESAGTIGLPDVEPPAPPPGPEPIADPGVPTRGPARRPR